MAGNANNIKTGSANPLHAFAEWASGVDNRWSELAVNRTINAFTDVIAVMVPGAHEAVCGKVWSLAKSWGLGKCSAVGFEAGLSAPMAAMVNGTSAHALDFDDNFDPAKAHATAVLAPALLALAEQRDLNGKQLIDAYIVGLQIIGRVGQGVNPFHRNRGWHATATVGAVGSAAGCARLLGLNAVETAHAISIATSMCGIPSREAIKEWRFDWGSTPFSASSRISARSAVDAPVAIFLVYCSWPGVSAIINLRFGVVK